MSKKGILIVGGGILQIAALKRAKELGFTTYLADGSDTCVGRPYADEFFTVSTKDIEKMADLAIELVKQKKIIGVYTQGTDVAYTVAYAAQKAGLPHVSPEAAKNCNDKIRMREILAEHGMVHTPFGRVKSESDLKTVLKKVGFPAYLKPSDNCASRGVTRLTSEEGSEAALKEALNACYYTKEAIVEKEIKGDEYSVDTVIHKGKLYPAGVSDRVFLKKEKYAVQSGSRTPSLLPESVQQEMYEVMDQAAKALGVTDGAFKGDLVVDEDGKVKIIEVTARTSGGFDSQRRKPLSFGIDIIKATIDIACGQEFDPRDLVPKWVKWSSTTSVFPSPGIVTDIAGIKETEAIPGVQDVMVLIKPGEEVKPYIHSATRTNYVICKADTLDQLIEVENKVQNTLKINTKPNA